MTHAQCLPRLWFFLYLSIPLSLSPSLDRSCVGPSEPPEPKQRIAAIMVAVPSSRLPILLDSNPSWLRPRLQAWTSS